MKELSVILRVKPVRKMKKEEYVFFADYFSFIPANAVLIPANYSIVVKASQLKLQILIR